MEYVRLGSAGVKVSRIALGLGFRGQSSVAAARRLIEHAIDSGVNFIDCANFYRVIGGPLSEEVLSPVLRKRRDEVVVTSKVYGHVGPGPNDGGSTRYHILSQVERSLQRLGTDHVDVYLLHQFDDETPVDETVRALDDLVTSGKTRYIGACNFAAWQVCKFLWTADRVGADPLVTIQNPYSLLNRTLEAEMFGLLRDQGLGAMAFSPLGAGLLSGLYTPGEPPPPGLAVGIKGRDAVRTLALRPGPRDHRRAARHRGGQGQDAGPSGPELGHVEAGDHGRDLGERHDRAAGREPGCGRLAPVGRGDGPPGPGVGGHDRQLRESVG